MSVAAARLDTTLARHVFWSAVSLSSSSIYIEEICPSISTPERTVRSTSAPRTAVLNDDVHHSVRSPKTKGLM